MLLASPALRERTLFAPLLRLFIPIVSGLCRFSFADKKWFVIVAGIASIVLLGLVMSEYGQKRAANEINRQRIRESQRTGDSAVLYLLPLPSKTHGYTPLETSNLHLGYLKDYYALQNKKIVVERTLDEPENRIFIQDALLVLSMNPVVKDGVFWAAVGELAPELGYSAGIINIFLRKGGGKCQP